MAGGATGHDLHIDGHLTNMAINYHPQGMIADVIAPILKVGNQSDTYIIWDHADAFRIEDDKRAPGVEANKIEKAVTSETYFANNYALKMPLTLEDRENMDPAFVVNRREGRVRFIKDKLMLSWEQRVVNLCTSGSNVGSYSGVSSDWMDTRSGYSDPLGDCWTAIDNVKDSMGYKPNRCIMGDMAWRYFRRHERVQHVIFGPTIPVGQNSKRQASIENFKAIYELDKFHVGRVYYNTAEEGQAEVLSLMWGDNVLFYYAPDEPMMEEPSFMYSFRWNRPAIPNMTVERHKYDPKTKSEELEVGYYQDEKIVAKNLAFLLTNVTSV